MARPVWKGTINFGLVNVPIQMFSAVKDESIRFHLVTKDGKCRLRQKLYCPETNKEYDFSETAKGYEIAPGEYVILDKEELKRLKPESGDVITIKDFIDMKEVDPIYFEKSYYLGPGKGGDKTYQLLFKVMSETGKVALAQFAMRQKGYLAIIRPMNRILCLSTMNYANEVVDAEDIADQLKDKSAVSPREMKIAKQLLEAMTGSFEPEKYEDEYSKDVMRLIESKAKGKPLSIPEPEAKRGKVIDLMDALKKSLQDTSKTSEKTAKASNRKSTTRKTEKKERRKA